MKKSPSFQDLAKQAKVSPATVSRVARGHITVAPAIREHVRKVARDMGIDLETRLHERANIVAFILSNRSVLHTFQSRVLQGAENYCTAQNRELMFMSFHYSAHVAPAELHLPQIVKHRSLVRAVILGGTNSANLLEALREQEIPFSVLGNNVLGEWNPADYDAVYSDDVQGAYDITRHLIDYGHRDVWFIGDSDFPWYARCAAGYRRAMTGAGLTPKMSEIHSDDRQMGYLALRSILSRGEKVTAIFAGSDPIARGVYEAARQAGLRIPEDLSVAGFNDSDGDLMYPTLTSVREFPEELGKHLAEFAIRRAQHLPVPAQQLTIPTRVIVRESTRPLNGS